MLGGCISAVVSEVGTGWSGSTTRYLVLQSAVCIEYAPTFDPSNAHQAAYKSLAMEHHADVAYFMVPDNISGSAWTIIRVGENADDLILTR